jgi:hypothetical protein
MKKEQRETYENINILFIFSYSHLGASLNLGEARKEKMMASYRPPHNGGRINWSGRMMPEKLGRKL